MNKYYRTENSIIDMSKIVAIETISASKRLKTYEVVFDTGAILKYETNSLLETYLDYLEDIEKNKNRKVLKELDGE